MNKKENNRKIKIGDRVKLKTDIEMFHINYDKGHEFNVVGKSRRGFDLEDDDGNKMHECLFIHDQLELVDKL